MNTSVNEATNAQKVGGPGHAVRVLCAGVPFGANNVGDEAIITGVVRMIRSVVPDAKITVATGDPETTQRALKVQTCPPFGFVGVPASGSEVERVIGEHDLFLWSGATGLSDYPDIPLGLLEIAQKLHKHSAVFCVGMNEELNPHLYQVRSRWRPAYDRIRQLTGGAIDIAGRLEAGRKARTYQRLRQILPRADFVVVRDVETEAVLQRVRVPAKIFVGSDAALGLHPSPLEKVLLPEVIRREMTTPDAPRIGICLSAQDPPRNLSGFVAVLDRLIEEKNAKVFGIPINPVTDSRLVRDMLPNFKHRDRVFSVEGVSEPEDVAGLLGQMDVIVSSRLHGLILASLSNVPLIGIRRGTKIDTFLRPYGLKPAGSFKDLDLGELERQIRQHLAAGADFRQRAAGVRAERMQGLDRARQQLKSLLERISIE
ncbi:MAG: polysaccharide pyruvyl transferase family protein [Verrucomicrobiota bacterium]